MCAKRKPELLILTEADVAAIRFALERIAYAPVDSEEQTSVNLLCRDISLAAISPGPVKLAFGPLRIVTAALEEVVLRADGSYPGTALPLPLLQALPFHTAACRRLLPAFSAAYDQMKARLGM